jgi:hypothetical protein
MHARDKNLHSTISDKSSRKYIRVKRGIGYDGKHYNEESNIMILPCMYRYAYIIRV